VTQAEIQSSALPPGTLNPGPFVQCSGVTKRYGEGPIILDRLSLEAQKGDFVSLIGPSGCGKSTLLKLLSGLSPITSGSVRIDGMPPESAREEMAFIFQEPTLFPWLTVAENVSLVLEIKGVERQCRAETVARCLELVRLAERANYHPRQLSGGQKMRVSIARALALSPRVMLLDEPFGALDEMTRDHLNEELLALRAKQSWTAFFVTHSVTEAVFLSNRVIVMSANPGRVHAEIPVPFAYPRTSATRRDPAFHALIDQVSGVLRSVEGADQHALR
jgi:NitT/TauT family transport system ATP-binding protein